MIPNVLHAVSITYKCSTHITEVFFAPRLLIHNTQELRDIFFLKPRCPIAKLLFQLFTVFYDWEVIQLGRLDVQLCRAVCI